MLLEMRLVNINDKWWNGHFTVDFEIKQEIYLDLCVIKNNLPNEEKNKKKLISIYWTILKWLQ